MERRSWYATLSFEGAMLTLVGKPSLVRRVLDIEKGQLCYAIGTIYMDMPLKPNVMEAIAKDVRSPLYCIIWC